MQGVWHPAGIKGGLAYLGETAEEEVFIAAFRFSVPDLVQGQKVAFARLRIGCVADRIYEPLRLTIAGVAEDSPAPCSSTRLPSALPKTTTSVAWQLAPSERASPRFFERTSPDIAPIINEILARRGWGASRKSILVVIAPEGAPDGTPDGAPRARGGHVRIQECTGHDRRRGPAVLEIFPSADDAFTGKIMLGRPTDTSITLSAFSLIPLDLFVEYALAAADAGRVTPTRSATVSVGASKPMEMILSGLERDAKYSYRAFWRPAGGVEALFRAGPGCCFHTQRGPGAEFVFTVQADSHMGTTVINKPGRRAKMYKRTLENAVAAEPDFHIDLGDFSRLEVVSRRSAGTLAEARERYASQRYFLADFCQEVPFFLALGNHEGEQGWRTTSAKDSILIWGTVARRELIPSPYPDSFYTGNPEIVSGAPVGDYYAWEWGDALFVVIDPFRYTLRRPHGVGRGVRASLDGWDWTLGREQYDWLYTTLHESRAKWKVVFAHHMTGGIVPTNEASDKKKAIGAYGRGGADAARYRVAHRPTFEWGGEDSTGAYVFDVRRPGWTHGPIHQMMVAEGVDIFFRGHDHVFVYETLDGIVYQTCPTPSAGRYYKGFFEPALFSTGTAVDDPGHLRVTVSSDSIRVDYVRSVLPADEPVLEDGVEVRNGDVSYTYTLRK